MTMESLLVEGKSAFGVVFFFLLLLLLCVWDTRLQGRNSYVVMGTTEMLLLLRTFWRPSAGL